MWCLLGRTETISPQLILGKNTRSKCVRVLDTVLKEMLRYRFYLFDSQNKELATKSAKILLKNFTDLATKATKLKDPALATDVEGLIALLNDELRLLSHKKTDTDFVASILERRNKFCNDMEVMSVIRNKAEEIVKEHLGIRERVYNRTDPLLNTLRAYPSIDKEGGVAVAETTANRVVIINGAYILTLSLRHFLAGLSGNNSQIYWYKNHITDLTRVIHEQGAVQKAMVENPNVEQHFNAPVGSVGNKGKINSSVGTQHNYAPEHKQNLAEAAAEIQKLLEQLEKSYPTETFSQKAVVAEETIKQIEADKNWKQKVINAVKAMGIEAFMEMIDNPVANVLRAGIEVWLEEDSD